MNASPLPHQALAPLHPAAQPAPRSVAIVLCNLGTPDAPTPKALRRYLAQFLSDRRVVEIPPLFWLPILHGIILRVRPRKAAAKYASVWSEAGSPLAVWTQRQAELLDKPFAEAVGKTAEFLRAQGKVEQVQSSYLPYVTSRFVNAALK